MVRTHLDYICDGGGVDSHAFFCYAAVMGLAKNKSVVEITMLLCSQVGYVLIGVF